MAAGMQPGMMPNMQPPNPYAMMNQSFQDRMMGGMNMGANNMNQAETFQMTQPNIANGMNQNAPNPNSQQIPTAATTGNLAQTGQLNQQPQQQPQQQQQQQQQQQSAASPAQQQGQTGIKNSSFSPDMLQVSVFN